MSYIRVSILNKEKKQYLCFDKGDVYLGSVRHEPGNMYPYNAYYIGGSFFDTADINEAFLHMQMSYTQDVQDFWPKREKRGIKRDEILHGIP